MEEIEGGATSRHDYVAVSRRHIVFAAPVAEAGASSGGSPDRAGA